MSCGNSRWPSRDSGNVVRLFPPEDRRTDPDAERERRFIVPPFAVKGSAALRARLAALTAVADAARPPCKLYSLAAFRAALAPTEGCTEHGATPSGGAGGPGEIVVSHISTVSPAPAIEQDESGAG